MTATSSYSATPSMSDEDIRASLIDKFIKVFEDADFIDYVNMMRFQAGTFELELQTHFHSKDSQPDVSYVMVKGLAGVFGNQDEAMRQILFGTNDIYVKIVTYSASGDYRYESLTDLETLEKINQKAISYEEWVSASSAGFR